MLDLAITWLPIIGPVIIGLGATIYYAPGANKSLAIWSGFGGVVLLFAGLCLHLQKLAWQEDPTKTSQSEIAQQRAYVDVVDGNVTHSAGSAPTARLVVRNTGQTPAVDLTWRTVFGFGLVSDIKKITLDATAKPIPYSLPRGESLSYEFTFIDWSVANDAALQSEAAAIIAIGEIRYKDVFGNSWSTDYQLVSGGRFPRRTGVASGRWGKLAE